jgi:hypothetical protein
MPKYVYLRQQCHLLDTMMYWQRMILVIRIVDTLYSSPATVLNARIYASTSTEVYVARYTLMAETILPFHLYHDTGNL